MVGAAGCSAPAVSQTQSQAEGAAAEATATTASALSAADAAQGSGHTPRPRHDRFVDARRGRDTFASGATNDCRLRYQPCATIQHGVDVAEAGDTVRVARGEYTENVVVAASVAIVGDGRGTVVRPAISAPKPCEDSSLCGGAASTVILVRANDVHIEGLTVDGDNRALTTGVNVFGANVDARNGIVTDYLAGAFDGFSVNDVVVRNVFFRGIYAASGGTFSIRDVDVRNVRGQAQAIAIMNFGGAGIIERAFVEDAADAIAANHSTGTVFRKNHVRASGSGVHTDNAGDAAGSAADLIEDNEIEACTETGYGAWVFAAYVAPSVRSNRIDGCYVGLAAFGQGVDVQATFDENRVNGRGKAGSVGVFVTTDKLGYGANDVGVSLTRNVVRRTDIGLEVQQTASFHANVAADCDVFARNATAVHSVSETATLHDSWLTRNDIGVDARDLASGTFDATQNYWGCASGPASSRCDSALGAVDATSPLSSPPACVHNLGTFVAFAD